MLDKLMLRIEKKLGIDLNEKYFVIGILPFVAYLIFAATTWGQASWGNIVGMAAGVGFNLAVYLVVVFALEYFLNGIGYETMDEIKKGNVAMALTLLALRLGVAIVIAKGIV